MLSIDDTTPELTGYDQIGQSIDSYNGAERYDFLREHHFSKSNENMIKTLKQLTKEYGIVPSYGLKLHTDLRIPFETHFVMELGSNNKIGIFVYDQKRHLSVKQVQNAEKSILKMSLNKGMIIANYIGTPARRETERINSDYDLPILKLEHLSTITKRFELDII